MIQLLAVQAALAQDVRFNGQLFRPSADATTTLWTEDTHTAPDGYFSGRSYLQYASRPVRWDGERLVSDLVGVDVLGAYHWKAFRLGAHLPTYLYTAGDLEIAEPGMGDLAFDLKGNLLDRTEAFVGLSLMGRILLPTASVEVPLGATGIGWEVLAAVDHDLGDLLLVGNLGTRGQPRAAYDDLVWNDQVFARVAAGYTLVDGAGASLELAAQTNWAAKRNPAGTAAELMAGGFGAVTDELSVRGGLGFGLSRSPGAPLARLVAGVSWEPDAYPDRDLDGIVDREDWCPDEPEDPDTYEDGDGCLDRSYTTKIELTDVAGERLDGIVVLEGPDHLVLERGDPYVSAHPGLYQATAMSEGQVAWAGEIEITAEQGRTVAIPMVAEAGSLAVFAVDALGNPVEAEVRLGNALAVPADGTPIALAAGEHAMIVVARGFKAAALPVTVHHGERRSLPIVLEATADPEPVAGPDGRLGRR